MVKRTVIQATNTRNIEISMRQACRLPERQHGARDLQYGVLNRHAGVPEIARTAKRVPVAPHRYRKHTTEPPRWEENTPALIRPAPV